jgi:hypothetical protein
MKEGLYAMTAAAACGAIAVLTPSATTWSTVIVWVASAMTVALIALAAAYFLGGQALAEQMDQLGLPPDGTPPPHDDDLPVL